MAAVKPTFVEFNPFLTMDCPAFHHKARRACSFGVTGY
jgi:hypothetical protein